MTTIADWCCECGSADLVAVRPGVEPERRGAIDLFNHRDSLIDTGERSMFWCAACWPYLRERREMA